MPQSVSEILQTFGPLRSSAVVGKLQKLGLAATAARQRVSRTKGEVCRLDAIPLPNREKFLFLREQYQTPAFWKSLIATLEETNSAYRYAVRSLSIRGGVKKAQLHRASGAPKRLSGHVSFDRVFQGLMTIGLVQENADSIVANPKWRPHPSIEGFETVFRVERMILPGVAEWLKKLGFVSYNKVAILDGEISPEFSSFGWDLVAPSYLSGLVTYSERKPNPGFFVADICLAGTLGEVDVEYFVQKCRVVRSIRKSRPFLAMLLAEFFDKEALQLGRSEGLIFATLDDFFGKGTLKATRTLIEVLMRAAEIAAANPDAIATILENLGKVEGAALNIRGALFELIVAHAVKRGQGGNIDVGRKVIAPDGGKAEIDVLHWHANQSVLAIECKGVSPTTAVGIDEVKYWLTRQVPVIREHCQSQHDLRCQNVRFEFWTSGSFAQDALDYLTDARDRIKKYEIGWKSGGEVGQYISTIHSTRLKNVYREHYESKLT